MENKTGIKVLHFFYWTPDKKVHLLCFTLKKNKMVLLKLTMKKTLHSSKYMYISLNQAQKQA